MVVRLWAVALLVMVTVTFGMAAPDGSVIVPTGPKFRDDWAIRNGEQIANNKVKIATKASREQSSFLDLMLPFSFVSPLRLTS